MGERNRGNGRHISPPQQSGRGMERGGRRGDQQVREPRLLPIRVYNTRDERRQTIYLYPARVRRPLKLLLDSGAEVSLIKKGVLNQPIVNDRSRSVVMDKDRINLCGYTHLFSHNKKDKFLVAYDDFPVDLDGIIGLDYLKNHDAVHDIRGNNLIIENNITVPLNSKIPMILRPEESRNFIIQTQYPTGIYMLKGEGIIDHIQDSKQGIFKIPGENPTRENKMIFFERLIFTPFIDTYTPRINNIKTRQNDTHERIQLLLQQTRLQHIRADEKLELETLITEYNDIFYLPGDSLPYIKGVAHDISLDTKESIHTKTFRYPPKHQEEIKTQTREMLKKGIIEESFSPYGSPLWVVPKKLDASGQQKWRIVVDFRKINDHTAQDNHPLPNIEEILERIGGSQFFSAFDLASGFYQILMKETAKEKTAFSTPDGHFQFRRMPMGLKNAPATFQRAMNHVLRGLIGNVCFVYLDDIIIFGRTRKEHNKHLKILLDRLREYGMKLQPDKCEYLRPELEYLGHVITKEGVKPNTKKIEAIQRLSEPRNAKDIKSFLGITGYYRKFIRNYSSISKPLTNLLKKEAEYKWDNNCRKSFKTLQNALVTEPVLKYPDHAQPFMLTTDASNLALGAVLSQKDEYGKERPVAYASRTLNDAETRYSTTEKELLAIVWATKHFRHFLYGKRFQIITDHRPLKWLMNVKDPSSRLMRWRLKLEEYDYEIEYKKGSQNTNADMLSRYIHATQEVEDTDEYLQYQTAIKSINLRNLTEVTQPPKNFKVITISLHGDIRYNPREELRELFFKLKGHMTTANEDICYDFSTEDGKEEIKRMLRYIFTTEEIYRAIRIKSNNTRKVTDINEQTEIILANHSNEHGHFGAIKTLERVKRVGHWATIRKDVEDFCSKCKTCQLIKRGKNITKCDGVLVPPPKSIGERIAIDFIGPLSPMIKGTNM